MTQQCIEFESVLEQQSGGPLPISAAAHMDVCAPCRQLFSDLEVIRTLGASLGAEDVAPPARLWPQLRAQLESEGLIRERANRWSLAEWFRSVPRLALAGASVAVVLMAALLVNFQSDGSYLARLRRLDFATSAPAPSLTSEIGKTLDGDLKRVLASLPQDNPSLASSLQENQGIVDNLIAVCEKSVREQPDDPVAREYLYGAYQQKAVLLATATDRSAMEGQ